jgi:hypothetical protein
LAGWSPELGLGPEVEKEGRWASNGEMWAEKRRRERAPGWAIRTKEKEERAGAGGPRVWLGRARGRRGEPARGEVFRFSFF